MEGGTLDFMAEVMDQKKKILDFIKKHKISVIATVNLENRYPRSEDRGSLIFAQNSLHPRLESRGFFAQNKPEAAVVDFAQTENLELIFHTLASTRKAQNIQINKNVAFVIGWDENITVQYEGEVGEISDSELEQDKKLYLLKIPEAVKWINEDESKFFKVSPRWIRYSDLNLDPWEIFEVRF
ncbi:hypothetical protein A2870_02130 [Candidatus Curtissbacteria bacterium RIFCSPHIGHO2_01_FULL_41_11]|uniref:Pyridoxamine 5'-phosphate oxidase N-terminal domain-containing protein n=1 Tax=Candidatus Curtissbacteria bacterium RIFCSPHIGHO2_01_FULL_41_11 TaxID=1797711 RepID=A0A1F5G401_9BACT|nr:MAG: hypothetical protein A2870_02130 [Candidatus Curtissbacteria bacterium RIFCSPHIGHO2_01_FULL_41_11]